MPEKDPAETGLVPAGGDPLSKNHLAFLGLAVSKFRALPLNAEEQQRYAVLIAQALLRICHSDNKNRSSGAAALESRASEAFGALDDEFQFANLMRNFVAEGDDDRRTIMRQTSELAQLREEVQRIRQTGQSEIDLRKTHDAELKYRKRRDLLSLLLSAVDLPEKGIVEVSSCSKVHLLQFDFEVHEQPLSVGKDLLLPLLQSAQRKPTLTPRIDFCCQPGKPAKNDVIPLPRVPPEIAKIYREQLWKIARFLTHSYQALGAFSANLRTYDVRGGWLGKRGSIPSRKLIGSLELDSLGAATNPFAAPDLFDRELVAAKIHSGVVAVQQFLISHEILKPALRQIKPEEILSELEARLVSEADGFYYEGIVVGIE